MARIRYRRRDEESSSHGVLFLTVGAIAGLAVGVILAQRFGGFEGLTSRLRDRSGRGPEGPVYDGEGYDDEDDFEEDEAETAGASGSDDIESRVLEAFRNDPVMGARAVDIGSVGESTIELSGWVHNDRESTHAVTLARGVPGVTTVVNRITVRGREAQYEDAARRVREGDDSLTEARWEGGRQGTGRRRQGNSSELDRHADPKADLEERYLREDAALRNPAEDLDAIGAERRSKAKNVKGDRTGGSPVAPTGVPKGDHVAEPTSDETQQVLREQTGRETRAD